MRLTQVLKVGAAAAVLAMVATACGGGNDSGSTSPGGGGSSNTGSALIDKAKNEKKLTVGIKFDQPGLGLKTPDGKYEGFDTDVARYIAKELGVEESGITFKEAKSAERETLIERGEVDFIVATYSITDSRKEKVSFVGPYFVAAQDLLVRQDSSDITGPESLNGKKLCSVRGSTSAQKVKDQFATQVQLQEYGTYSECVTQLLSGVIDAVTTDDVILAGYAAQQSGKMKVVGKGFSTENYGVGFKKGDHAAEEAIGNAIDKMMDDGSWKASLEKHVGPSGYTIPAAPELQHQS